MCIKTILVQAALGASFCQRRCCADPSFHLAAELVFGVSTARAARNGHSVARPRSLRSTRAPDGFRRCETVLGCTLPKEVSETGGQNGENWRAQRQSLRYDHLPFNRRLVDCSPGRPAGSRRWESQSMRHPTRWTVERVKSVLCFLFAYLYDLSTDLCVTPFFFGDISAHHKKCIEVLYRRRNEFE